ncbi:sarcosine oxidase [Fusarium heterosporum]|uniref:Sarcosine oxidase n=1 Tax=Fusarium heterosporum TaxID=42747 RepID=A0A8H5T7W5_FUSHE|nr:sarcosine oxidase [Fusarium heterosporum]
MTSKLSSKSAPIIVVGAGVFGLSTAIHLAERGYTNVKVLDKQQYHHSEYSYNKGCDAASADINKIIRAAYGKEFWYQNLAIDAITKWKEWNNDIKTGVTIPPGTSTSDTLFVNNGCLTIRSDPSLSQFDRDTIENMAKVGMQHTQIDLSSPSDLERAEAQGFDFVLKAFDLKGSSALLDTQSGFVYADKACHFALHKAESLGVQFIFGESKGKFLSLIENNESQITGVRTVDGTAHSAELTIMVCGGWTPSLVTGLDNLCETTAGSVFMFQLPPDKAMWERFAPENFPTWSYNIHHGKHGGLYGFARDPNGVVKIGYRGTKFTNPQVQPDGNVRSTPKTRWTEESIHQVPLLGAQVVKTFVDEFLPELMECEVSTRLCWYTDSFDNQFVVDFVPNFQGLMVATGGSGHGFKFLPTLGEHVVDKIEGKKNDYLDLWKWRGLEPGNKPFNSLMEGVTSERSLSHQPLTTFSGSTDKLSQL